MKRFFRLSLEFVFCASLVLTTSCGLVRTFYGEPDAANPTALDPNSPAAQIVKVLNFIPGWGQLAAGVISLGGAGYGVYKTSKNAADKVIAAHIEEHHSDVPLIVPDSPATACPTCGQAKA